MRPSAGYFRGGYGFFIRVESTRPHCFAVQKGTTRRYILSVEYLGTIRFDIRH